MSKLYKYSLPLFASIALIVNLIQPIHSLKINVSILAMIAICLFCLIWFLRQKIKLLRIVLFFIFIPFLPLINQTKINEKVIQEYYINYLRGYEGTIYVWGGEGFLGIDCSGLPRSSFIKANFKYAYIHFNGKALKKAVWLWWFDASAKEMYYGYKGALIVENNSFKIKDLRQEVEPGDIVTNGSHVMVYLSKDEIIQSDPDRNKVVIDTLPSENHWYRMEVKLVKWKWNE